MKYIITENKFDVIFEKAMDRFFDLDDLHYVFGEFYDDETGDIIDEFEAAIEFYFGDYSDDDTFGRRYDSDYFSVECSKCPYFSIEIIPLRKISSMFGEIKVWEKYFINWFNKRFPEYPIKNVE